MIVDVWHDNMWYDTWIYMIYLRLRIDAKLLMFQELLIISQCTSFFWLRAFFLFLSFSWFFCFLHKVRSCDQSMFSRDRSGSRDSTPTVPNWPRQDFRCALLLFCQPFSGSASQFGPEQVPNREMEPKTGFKKDWGCVWVKFEGLCHDILQNNDFIWQ